MKYTPNYHLPLADPEDPVRRADFNAAFDILDAAVAVGPGKYGYLVTLLDDVGDPVAGLPISGVSSSAGGTCVTGADGTALGVSTAASVTLTVASPYINLQSISQAVTSTGIITKVTLAFQRKVDPVSVIASTQIVAFSPSVRSFDCAVCGAGGGGASQGNYGGNGFSGPGGGGGYVAEKRSITHAAGSKYQVNIGSGGYGGSGSNVPGGTGGTTTITNKVTGEVLCTASGGEGGKVPTGYGTVPGGTGNGNGGNGTDGSNVNAGGAAIQSSELLPNASGAGGSGAKVYTVGGGRNSGAPGAPNTGGWGGWTYVRAPGDYTSNPGGAGSQPGGGGGGAHGVGGMTAAPGGNGGAGAAAVKVYY